MLHALEGRCKGVRWLDEERFRFDCPLDDSHAVIARMAGGRLVLFCVEGHTQEQILEALGPEPSTSNGLIAGAREPEETFSANGTGAHASSKAKHAIAYARRGFGVFPCHNIDPDGECSCGKLMCASAGKHPRYRDWQTDATTSEAQIRRWWSEYPESNIGVACGGRSKLTVLDVDGQTGRETLRQLELDNGELPETPIAITGSGGAHYYFQHAPGLSNAVRFAEGLDVRTDGGLVVGVGSRTKGTYEWEAIASIANVPLAVMPLWLMEKIKTAGRNGDGRTEGFKASDEPIREGEGRNNYLYRLGRSLKAKNLPVVAIRAALAACNREQCKPPLADDEFLVLVNQVLKQPDQQGFGQNGTEHQEPEEKISALQLSQLYQVIDQWDRQPWVWDGILPHSSLSLIVGKSETGKSTLIYSLIYAVVTGTPFFGRDCEQGKVLYLAGDPMSEIVAGKTFRELGLTEGVIVVPDALVMNPTGMQQLRALVAELKPILVIGDTLAATVEIDPDKYSQSYQAQLPLTRMARELGPNFLMSHHSQKSAIDSYGVIDAALGSVGVAAVASSRMATRFYRRKAGKFYTFEMSNLRIGNPLEGEYIVHKLQNGLVEIAGLWKLESISLDKQAVIDVLGRQTEPIAKRTLWGEIRPKPKWDAYNQALDELFAEEKIAVKTGPRGGKLFSLKSV